MNEPFGERLSRDLSGLDDVAVADVDAVRSAVAVVVRRRRRARRAGACVVSSLLIVGVAVAVGSHRGAPETATSPTTVAPTTSSPNPTTTTSSPSTSTTAPGSRWTPLPPDPRGLVYYPTVVWTGRDAIVVCGNDVDGNALPGATAYTPATNSWRRLADPLGAARLHPLTVWTGSVVLMVGGDDPAHSLPVPSSAGQRYDPTTDNWTYIAPPLGTIDDQSPFVWTGTRLLVWPGEGHPSTSGTPVAYDPVADSWTVVSSPPIGSRSSAASVWTGTEWIVWGGTDGTKELSDGAAYDPSTDTWRTLAPSPLTGRRVSAVWTGTEMLVDAGSSGGDPVTGNGELALADGAAYNPATDSWRTISAGPAHPGFLPIWTGTYMVLFAKGSGVVYDPAHDTWTGCCDERGPTGTPLWTGTEVIVLGGADATSGGAVFTPP